ncbi:hypothetical protein RND81_06G072400 [Saponaria officinalis]|uniref:Uncharacterized protein n=1 Tax=Saponaria officinalis TaxID=3572 RepID=A0AAW1K8H9_SAPOF
MNSQPSEGSNSIPAVIPQNEVILGEAENQNFFNEPPLDGVPLNNVEQYRAMHIEWELDLVNRIRILENRMISGLPPQLNHGEYEALVKGFLNETISISHYTSTLNRELYERKIFEWKGHLVDRLF